MQRLTLGIASVLGAITLLGASATTAGAQELTLAQARTAVDAAEAEARANGWNLTILVADAEGIPVYLRRMDGASARTHDIVGRKVHVVLTTGGTSLAYGQALAAGTIDSIPGGIHYEGGLPIRMNGALVGAMAASGARGSEDAQVVRAGLAAMGADPVGDGAPAENVAVTVRVEGIRNTTGTIDIGLFDEDGREGFPGSGPVRAEIIPADTAGVEVTFDGLPAGRYAVGLLHDENGNGDIDINDFGMPVEGYGTSGEGVAMGPPSFDQAALTVEEDTTITIRMVYLGGE